MAAHVSVTTTSVSQVNGEEILTRFEISHIKDMENMWNWWELNGNPMKWVCKTIFFNKECRHTDNKCYLICAPESLDTSKLKGGAITVLTAENLWSNNPLSDNKKSFNNNNYF